jgi:putative transposase
VVRSSKHSLKFSNEEKLKSLSDLREVIKNSVSSYISLIKSKKLPFNKLLTSKVLPEVNGIKHSQWKQVIYKEASQIVRSNIQYQKKKVFNRYKKIYAKCMKENKHSKFTSKKFSELNINYLKRIKIDLKKISINIDQRLFDTEIKKEGEFDEFVMLRLPWFEEKRKLAQTIKLPIKYHKHSLKFSDWKKHNTIKLTWKNDIPYICFSYEKDEKEKPSYPKKEIGIDIGYKKLITDSNGRTYGKELYDVYDKISKKKKGSKKYKRSLTHRTNLTNKIGNDFYQQNTFDLLVMEDLKAVKHKSKLSRKTNNKLQYWSYRTLIDKLERLSEEKGFHIQKVNPAYTSQQCSKCGLIDKSNRTGESYQCSCGMEMDADINAAKNILQRGDYNPSSFETNLLTSL